MMQMTDALVTDDPWTQAMRQGDFAAAWRISDMGLRARMSRCETCWHWPRHHQFVWSGAPLAGRRVFVRCYHGLGDTIQFHPLRRAAAASGERRDRVGAARADTVARGAEGAAGDDLAAQHVADAHRVLRPNGVLVILNYSYRGSLDRDRDEVTQLASDHGFAVQNRGACEFRLWDAVAFELRRTE